MKKKNGTSQKAVKERNARFVQAFMAAGENATEAYMVIRPNVARTTAGTEGHRLLKVPAIHQAIEEARAKLRAKFALTTERVVQELARVAYFNPRRMLDGKGKALKLHMLDEDTAAGLTIELDGDGKVLKMRTVPPSAKNTAVKQAVKILRLEDKPPPPPPDPEGNQVLSADPRDTARRMLFLLRKGAVEDERKAQPAPKAAKKKVPAAA